MSGLGREGSAAALVEEETEAILDETVLPERLQQLIQVSLAVIHHERQEQL